MKNIAITLAARDISRIAIYLEKGEGEIEDILVEIINQSDKQK